MTTEPSTEDLKRKVSYAQTMGQLAKDISAWQWCVLTDDVSTRDLLMNVTRTLQIAMDEADALRKTVP